MNKTQRNTMMKANVFILPAIMILLSVIPLTAQELDSQELLEKYQQVLAENRNYRSFRYDEGAPKEVFNIYTDKDGYLWLMEFLHYNPASEPIVLIYRFNGIEFVDMFRDYPAQERQNLNNIYVLSDSSILVTGKKYVYRWNGHEFIRFSFEESDVIQGAFYSSETGFFVCIGSYGYGLLSDDNCWRYISIKDTSTLNHWDTIFTRDQHSFRQKIYAPIFAVDNQGGFFWGKVTQEYHRQRSSLNHAPTKQVIWEDDFYLNTFSRGSQDSIFVENREFLQQLEAGDPVLFNCPKGNVWLYFQNTNLLYLIDSTINQSLPYHLPEGFAIIRTQNIGQTTWFSYTYDNRLHISEQHYGSELMLNSYKLDLPERAHKDYANVNIIIDNEMFHIYRDLSNLFGTMRYWTSENFLFIYDRASRKPVQLNIPQINFKHQGRYPSVRLYESNIVFSVADSTVNNTHNLFVFDIENNELVRKRIADNSHSLRIIRFCEKENIVMVAGNEQYWKIPLEKPIVLRNEFNQTDIRTKLNSYCFSSQTILARETSDRRRQIHNIEFYKLINHRFELLRCFDDTSVHSVDYESKIFYLIKLKEDSDTKALLRYDIFEDEVDKLTSNIDSNKLLFGDGTITLLTKDYYNSWYAESDAQTVKGGDLFALRDTFNPFLEPYNLNVKDLFPYLSFTKLSEQEMFVESLSLSLNQSNGQHSLAIITVFNRIKPNVSLELIYEDGAVLKIPPFIYNLQDDTIVFKPDWIQAFNTNSEVYIYLLEENYDGDQQVRISEYRDGKIYTHDSYFQLSMDGENIPNIELFTTNSQILVQYEDILLYYRNSLFTEIFNIGELFKLHETNRINNIISFDKIFYIIIGGRGLISYNRDSEIISYYLSRDGLPRPIDDIFTDEEDNLLILGENALYQLVETDRNARLTIPWMQAGENRYSADKPFRSKHNQSNLIVPVDILHLMYPEKSTLRYRLNGFENEWRTRPYQAQIEYPNLPPGRYNLEILAFTPQGVELPVQSFPFRILPPWYRSWLAYLVYLLVVIAALRTIFVLRTRRLQQRNLILEQQVSERTEELNQSNIELKEKTYLLQERQERIKESIDYASLIQRSILPQQNDLAKVFNDYFILWKPRDVVGGDFYWLHNIEETGETLFAVIDCTGHGVPGALISMSVYSLLNNIVRDRNIIEPAEILNNVHRDIGAALHQESGHTQQDGLDMSLVKLNRDKKRLTFAGAALHLIYYDGIEPCLRHIKGTKHSIGGMKWQKQIVFEQVDLPYSANAILYLYSDGIIDQPQVDKERLVRFGHPRWLELLSGIYTEPLSVQHQIMEEKLNELLSYHEQRDDITIVAIKT